MRMKSAVLAFVVAFALTGCSHRWDSVSVTPVSDDPKPVALKDLRGQVLLLEFWATWCGPCRQLAPTIEEYYKRYTPKGLKVMAITDEPASTVERYRSMHRYSTPYYTDESREAFKAFGVRGVPTVILLGKNGDMIARADGFPLPADFEDKIRAALE